jgi:hypothetical protein
MKNTILIIKYLLMLVVLVMMSCNYMNSTVIYYSCIWYCRIVVFSILVDFVIRVYKNHAPQK